MSGIGHGARPDLPDAGEGMCCAGAAINGPHRCTCWRPVYDIEQVDPLPDVPQVRPAGMCGDCAYRPGSPERQGDPDHAGDAELLDDLAASGTPFWCHDGIRRPARWVHPPTGIEVPGHPADYEPPMVGAVPFRANGRMAFLCAGWAARGRALAARDAR